jgi:hypothetical protein
MNYKNHYDDEAHDNEKNSEGDREEDHSNDEDSEDNREKFRNDNNSYSGQRIDINLTQVENDEAIKIKQNNIINIEETEYILESEEMNKRYGRRTVTYNLRAPRFRDYSQLHVMADHITKTQYSLKKGIQVFGDAG